MTTTNKALHDALCEIRTLALVHLGPSYPRILPLGDDRIREIVQIATAALDRKAVPA